MRLEHHLVGGYVRYISPHIIISCYDLIVVTAIVSVKILIFFNYYYSSFPPKPYCLNV